MYPEISFSLSLELSQNYHLPTFTFFIEQSHELDYIRTETQHIFIKKIASFLSFEELLQKKAHFVSILQRIFPSKKFQEADILLSIHE